MTWTHEEKEGRRGIKGNGQSGVLRSFGVDLEESDIGEYGF